MKLIGNSYDNHGVLCCWRCQKELGSEIHYIEIITERALCRGCYTIAKNLQSKPEWD